MVAEFVAAADQRRERQGMTQAEPVHVAPGREFAEALAGRVKGFAQHPRRRTVVECREILDQHALDPGEAAIGFGMVRADRPLGEELREMAIDQLEGDRAAVRCPVMPVPVAHQRQNFGALRRQRLRQVQLFGALENRVPHRDRRRHVDVELDRLHVRHRMFLPGGQHLPDPDDAVVG